MQIKNDSLQEFDEKLSDPEIAIMDRLNSPVLIQEFLDSTSYPSSEQNRSPLEVLHQRKAHCLDGGLFAAAALRRIGFPPLILDMQPEKGMDDDHVLALYQVDDHWGAIAKSNFSGLRYREPIYRTPRDLVLSYFEWFFNLDGIKTLRYYSRVIDLRRFDKLKWMTTSEGVDALEGYLKTVKLTSLLSSAQIARLVPMDKRTYEAGTLGINPEGAFRPK